MDQSEYMKGDIKDIINWNVKPRTKVPCDSPCCDSLNKEAGGERARREQSGSLFCGPPHAPPQRTPRHCSGQESCPLLIHKAPRAAAPRGQRLTLGGSQLGQGRARNPARANRPYLWGSQLDIKQEELLFLCMPCSLRETVYRGTEKTDGHSEKGLEDSSKVLRPERRSVPEIQLPSWLWFVRPPV